MKTLHLLFLSLTLLIMPIVGAKAEVALDEDYDYDDTNPIFYATPQEAHPFSYEEFDQELKMIESVEKISPTMAESYETKNEIKEDNVSTTLAAPVHEQITEKRPRRTRSR